MFHNVARDSGGHPANYRGYQPGHPLVRVFEADVDPAEVAVKPMRSAPCDPSAPRRPITPEQIAAGLFDAFNDDAENLPPALAALAAAYRARRLRSLSVGDVVVIGEVPLLVAPRGFAIVTGQVDETVTADHGTVPFRPARQIRPPDEPGVEPQL